MVPNLFWTLTEFTAAIALSNASASPAAPDSPPAQAASTPGAAPGGFELVATYGDFDETTGLDAATAWRMILILRRA